MILFSHTITPRLQYIADFIGKEISGREIQLTTDKELFLRAALPRINYSNEKISENEFYLRPHSLLFENNIRTREMICFDCNRQKAFFKTDGDFPFDVFAAAFYLLSRYEEYVPHRKDIYGRYAHENSLAFRENFLHIPLINIWLQNLKESFRRRYPGHRFPENSFQFLPTYDIDEAWSYRYKSSWRTMGGYARSFIKGNLYEFRERFKVRSGLEPDPFDSCDYLDELNGKFNLQPIYFFLVAEKTGKYDKNILPAEPEMRELIRRHAGKYAIGIHPSWQSGDDSRKLKQEIQQLGEITGKQILSSRQHFIRLTLPETCRSLIGAGIKYDYSMGYGSINGFRASVASPFYWYDLEKEETSRLLLYPFCYMEANSFYEQKFSPQRALEEMTHYFQEVKKVNGTLIIIWHNTFLGSDKKFKGWREVYEQFLQLLQH